MKSWDVRKSCVILGGFWKGGQSGGCGKGLFLAETWIFFEKRANEK